MHLQQTKAGSRATGGPQYYFHDVPEHIKDQLRKKGAYEVVLHTPYGIARSSFVAVGRDHKLGPNGAISRGRVGHDRIQQASGTQSIGEAIRRWYNLPADIDFERIDVDVTIDTGLKNTGLFILTPLKVSMRSRRRAVEMPRRHYPLSFHHSHESPLWKAHLRSLAANMPNDFSWAADQLSRIVRDHRRTDVSSILESDLLRASGALAKLGLQLGPYVGKHYDCDPSEFRLDSYPPYECAVEVKKRSRGFGYQMLRYKPLPRAVVLCLEHTLVNVPDHVDVLELTTLAAFLNRQ